MGIESIEKNKDTVLLNEEKTYAPVELDMSSSEKEILRALKVYDPEDIHLTIDNKLTLSDKETKEMLAKIENNEHNPRLYRGYDVAKDGELQLRNKHLGQDSSTHSEGGNILLGGEMLGKYMIRQIEGKYLNVWLETLKNGLPCEKIVKDKYGKFRIYKDYKAGLYRVYSHILPGILVEQFDNDKVSHLKRVIISKLKNIGIDGGLHMFHDSNWILKHDGGNNFSLWMIDFDSDYYAGSIPDGEYVKQNYKKIEDLPELSDTIVSTSLISRALDNSFIFKFPDSIKRFFLNASKR